MLVRPRTPKGRKKRRTLGKDLWTEGTAKAVFISSFHGPFLDLILLGVLHLRVGKTVLPLKTFEKFHIP